MPDRNRLYSFALAVELDGVGHPLILARSRRRGLTRARVVLARDRRLLRSALGPLARHLLGLGLHFLEFEAPTGAGFPEALFRTGAWPVQTTHAPETAAIDHSFTELAFMPVPGVELDGPRL